MIFQIIKDFLTSNDNFYINFKETLNFLSLLLQSQLQISELIFKLKVLFKKLEKSYNSIIPLM
ncbi:unnamed protein product [Paramecium sonneborni]|uniref:Uncharacterized protein n=1 Tax=Paramecium sonneborni TaxID=65129 RepID=A0A8S1QWK9_9CILI|nr:unnamed protein product [Paramecium sonneborni]CAD8119793.1 unnamed protein product [Paramecium sonneborni]